MPVQLKKFSKQEWDLQIAVRKYHGKYFFVIIKEKRKEIFLFMDQNKKKKYKQTFREYDALLESFKGIDIEPYWPSEEDFILFEENPEKWFELLIYMSEMVEATCIKEEYSLNRINRFLRDHLVLVESHKEKF